MASLKKKASDVKLNSTEDIVRFMLESDEEISDCSSSDFDDVIDGTDISTEEDSDDDMEKSIAENNQSIVTQPVSFVVPIKKRQRMTTKKTKVMDNLCWTKCKPVSSMCRQIFHSEPGVHESVTSDDPLEIFELLFTNELIDMIVKMTNKYADQSNIGKLHSKTSRLSKWVDTTPSDIRMYLAVLKYRGLLHKPRNDWYYSKNLLITTPGFRRLMSQNKLLLIEKYLHFVDNQELEENYNRSAKIQPVLVSLIEHFKLLLNLSRDISIDESLPLRKGRLSWKQYIRIKRARFGQKSFVLCDAATGYIWNVIIYTGADTLGIDNCDEDYHASEIILSLLDGLLDLGHCIYIDNWYTSIEICKILKQRSTDLIGTIRRDRKGLPLSVTKVKLKRGERVVEYENTLGISLLNWKDKRDVFMMSTCIPDTEKIVVRRGIQAKIPTVIHEYNQLMVGVDRSDQMMTSYPTERKRVKKWYKKAFSHLVNMASFNAHIIHKSRYFCAKCDVALCVAPCLEKYHTVLKY
ncbi:piggyBac transposable element-derived protein 4-like [Hydra vulgaris]|uniref:PiggyBac transposable element-derived protein 4-like n=1 Tax=Hydra vulgaris TaxID=6087 RepID=A0ABM4BSG6_HYDVU